ncbi:MAG: DUF2274 domain-containing protein [Rhizomicrobium sp.]
MAAELKLQRLPDRNPVKITITVQPALNNALRAYADLYRESYGEDETIAELIPYMLQGFLESDRNFSKAMKEDGASPPSRSARRNSGDETSKT